MVQEADLTNGPQVKGQDMTVEEQLDHWIAGRSIHNTGRGECCPDFSCCNDKMNTPIEVRRKFIDADAQTRSGMLGYFLGEAFATLNDDKEVYIAGQGPEH